ncbi:MAG: DUF1489 domain-containing protein [Sphingomonas sp.]|uniref:DUF1489 family protein n=1 Tax=Sphingomonas sp. TaxID=28214 RepID=UPI0025CBCFCB|nr:DUF1489 family protein [Sphingomonas sp.]MBY0283163.1 DUF1489 domain-containing protein [Sphingomonas sp.]
MLHLSKVAFGAQSLDHLAERLAVRDAEGPLFLTTRYLPKRHAEIAGLGSLFWILKHQLVARSPIIGFGEALEGKVAILLGMPLVAVRPIPKRAHQGWRYLEASDAPVDLGVGESGETLPAGLARDLAALALL